MLLAGTNEALNTVNLVITGAVSIILAWLSIQRNKDKKEANERHREASVERADAAHTTEQVLRSVTPTNGYQTMGEALEAVERRVDELAERLARGDARFDNMEEAEHRIAEQLAVVTDFTKDMAGRLQTGDAQFRSIEAKQAEMLAQHGEARGDMRKVAESLERLRAGFERDDPLRRRAVEEWGEDGRKRRKREGGR